MNYREGLQFWLFLLVSVMFICSNAEAGIQCYECHGTKSPPDYRPLDAPYRNISTGGFQGNHRTHIPETAGFSSCEKCHSGSSGYSTNHRDGKIKLSANINGSPAKALYKNTTSAFPQTAVPSLGTCTSVNCHFEATTPTWGDPQFTYPADCNRCHGAPPSGGTTGAAGSHAIHESHYAGVANCKVCHADHSSFSHATSAGRQLVVAPRHPTDPTPGTYTGLVTDYLPSQTNTFGTCSNFYCHSAGTSPSTGTLPPFTTDSWGYGIQQNELLCGKCHSYPPDYPNGTPKMNSHKVTDHAQYSCRKCHYSTTTTGYSITNPANHVNKTYDVVGFPQNLFTYAFAPSGGTCSNVGCHADTEPRKWGVSLVCDYCHECPPATGSHLKHFGGTVADVGSYGDTRITKDYGANNSQYVMSCGNCHPVDFLNHRNGKVDILLYDPQAPSDSLKARNPATAKYTPGPVTLYDSRYYPYTQGTCDNVYCHSYNDWTTPTDCVFTNESGSRYCDSYAEANLVVTKKYKPAVWGSAFPNDCTGCHANAPTTTSADNDGGTGNTHAWVDPEGWEEGHFIKWAFPADPITCNYCHNDTVKELSKWSRPAPTYFTIFSGVPIANKAKHVNGTVDVAFDTTRPFIYSYSRYGEPPIQVFKWLSTASYQPSTKSCSSVSCHKGQTTVKWGTPYRAYKSDNGIDYRCLECHTSGYW